MLFPEGHYMDIYNGMLILDPSHLVCKDTDNSSLGTEGELTRLASRLRNSKFWCCRLQCAPHITITSHVPCRMTLCQAYGVLSLRLCTQPGCELCWPHHQLQSRYCSSATSSISPTSLHNACAHALVFYVKWIRGASVVDGGGFVEVPLKRYLWRHAHILAAICLIV